MLEHTDLCSSSSSAAEPPASRKRQLRDAATADAALKRLCTGTEHPQAEQAAAKQQPLPALSVAADGVVTPFSTTSEHSESAAPAQLRVAVIVPFRDAHATQQRQAHLDAFVPHLTALLRRQPALSAFHIFVVEQARDGRKFNRGKLLNAGFDITRNDFDVFVFHDVDLLPGDDLGAYYAQKPELGPLHIARVWDRYNGNPKYFGGIVAFTRKDFIKINGFPNNFWGWGGEDDELYCRVLKKKLKIQSPLSGTITDLEDMGLQEKLETLRSTKWKCTVKRELLKEHARTWKKNGIKSLKYDPVNAVALSECCTKITVLLGPNDHWSDARSSLDHETAALSDGELDQDSLQEQHHQSSDLPSDDYQQPDTSTSEAQDSR